MTKPKPSLLVFVVLILMSASLTGCGTIISGTTQNVSVCSTPDHAKVTIYDARENKAIAAQVTPCTIALKRGQGYFRRGEYRLVVEKEVCNSREVLISDRVTGWYIGGNALLEGLIGWVIVDPLTGGMWYLSPNEVDVNLKQEGITSTAPASDPEVSSVPKPLMPIRN